MFTHRQLYNKFFDLYEIVCQITRDYSKGNKTITIYAKMMFLLLQRSNSALKDNFNAHGKFDDIIDVIYRITVL